MEKEKYKAINRKYRKPENYPNIIAPKVQL